MILETLRHEILTCEKNRNQISIDTGVDNTVLFRIVHGGSCSLQTAETLCKYLGLQLVSKRRQKKKKRRRR